MTVPTGSNFFSEYGSFAPTSVLRPSLERFLLRQELQHEEHEDECIQEVV